VAYVSARKHTVLQNMATLSDTAGLTVTPEIHFTDSSIID